MAELRPRPFISRTHLHPRDGSSPGQASLSLSLSLSRESRRRVGGERVDVAKFGVKARRPTRRFASRKSQDWRSAVERGMPSNAPCDGCFCCRIANGLLQELRSVHERDLEEAGRWQARAAGRARSE